MTTERSAPGGGSSASSTGTEEFVRALDPRGLYLRAGTWLLILPETLGWYEKVVYQGHTMKKREEDWLLIIRATKGGHAIVSFFSGPSPTECVRSAAVAARRKEMRWKSDRFA